MDTLSFSYNDSSESVHPTNRLRPAQLKSIEKLGTSKYRTSKWSMDCIDIESIKKEFRRKVSESKRAVVRPNDTFSVHTSSEKLSCLFKMGSDRGNCNPHDNYGRSVRTSTSKISRSGLDTITLDTGPSSKTEKGPLIEFCTFSKYLGEWNMLGMTGEGVYQYPHGVIYDGNFNADGLYHGRGTLLYPNGQRLHGIWDNGELTNDFRCYSEEVIFDLKDRRFSYEQKNSLGVPGKEYRTNQQPTPEIPENCYDLVEGIYCPEVGYIISHRPTNRFEKECIVKSGSNNTERCYEDYYEIMNDKSEEECKVESWLNSDLHHTFDENDQRMLDIPSAEKAEWIKKFCRTNPEQPVGYNPDLYEVFTIGTRSEIEEIKEHGTLQSCYAEACPDIDETIPKKTISFVQKVVKEKRKRTLDSPRVKKKSTFLKRYGQYTKTDIFSTFDGDSLYFNTPMGSLRRRSLVPLSLDKYRNRLREHPFSSAEHSAATIVVTDNRSEASSSNNKDEVLGKNKLERRIHELFSNVMRIVTSDSDISATDEVSNE